MDYEAIITNIGHFGNYQKKGRKLTECIVLVIQILCLFPLYFIKTSEILIVLRFFGGISSVGIFSTSFVLALEIVPLAYQTIVGLYSQIMFSVGELVVVGIAYCTQEWHLLSLVMAVFCFFLLFFIFGFDESPRWLISTGKQDKAEAILRKIAKRNKKESYVMLSEKPCEKKTAAVNGSFGDIFKSKILLNRSFNIFFNWTAVNTVYYGLVFGSATLAGNLFGAQMKSKFGVGLPGIFFGILSIIAGLLSLFLPETKGCSLPDTFEEGENIGRTLEHTKLSFKKWAKKINSN
ncbi:organic cation transporter protein-like [Octopus vulgaris]|uniref:Organic cation transporter protein-like n=1 Tax=Octopus vulgaris TaxID=6645 RepID=A0AA36B7S5_OCTVU|nr:organic cation transporter protein-like [Octopus vulgaris]